MRAQADAEGAVFDVDVEVREGAAIAGAKGTFGDGRPASRPSAAWRTRVRSDRAGAGAGQGWPCAVGRRGGGECDGKKGEGEVVRLQAPQSVESRQSSMVAFPSATQSRATSGTTTFPSAGGSGRSLHTWPRSLWPRLARRLLRRASLGAGRRNTVPGSSRCSRT
ncbi:hypothetical protein A7982_12624 [Minicystis rosea]|nr:hypothetical protein A7982_12624 [Minicystis rosea]